MAARALADAANIFRTFQQKHEAGGRQVFTKKLDYYLDALKFNSETTMDGLDEEIKLMKRLIEQTNELRLARIKST